MAMNPAVAAAIAQQIEDLRSTADFYAARHAAVLEEAEDLRTKEVETRAKITELEEAME